MIFLKGLKKAVVKENLDVIHLQEWFMPMGWQLRKQKSLVLTQRIEKLPTSIKNIMYILQALFVILYTTFSQNGMMSVLNAKFA